MPYNKKIAYYKSRESSKRTYYESLGMDIHIGSVIRKNIQNENVRIITNVKKYIKNIYKHNAVGGYLHICLDDFNLEDNHIVWCLENEIPKEKDAYLHSQYYYCAICLLKLSYSKRKKIVMNCKN